jgi:hypothetical protein
MEEEVDNSATRGDAIEFLKTKIIYIPKVKK